MFSGRRFIKAKGVCLMTCLEQKFCGDARCLVKGPQPIASFSPNRQRRDRFNLYCKACCVRRVRQYRAHEKTRRAARKVAHVAREVKSAPLPVPKRKKPTLRDRVWEAISAGRARTQEQIKRLVGVGYDELGDSLAELMLNEGRVKTALIKGGSVRIYFPGPAPESTAAAAAPRSFSTLRGLMPTLDAFRGLKP